MAIQPVEYSVAVLRTQTAASKAKGTQNPTYLDKVSCDDGEFSLRTRQPDSFDDEVASG